MECKEAVQSLVYAAARFSEFPELRDLRSVFIDRYGPPLEVFVNKEVITHAPLHYLLINHIGPGLFIEVILVFLY